MEVKNNEELEILKSIEKLLFFLSRQFFTNTYEKLDKDEQIIYDLTG